MLEVEVISWVTLNPFPGKFILESIINNNQLIYKNLLCSDYAIKSPATIYLQVASELLKTMTSLTLPSNHARTIYSRLFIDFVSTSL